MHNPYAVKIEPVRGCTKRCPFCALRNTDWGKQQTCDPATFDYMPFPVFKTAMDSLSTWLVRPRIEFNERGEPLAHKSIYAMLRYARASIPRAQLTIITNGTMLTSREQVEELFACGLNFLFVDCYTEREYEQKLPMLRRYAPKGFFDDTAHPYHYVNHVHRTVIIKPAFPMQDGRMQQNVILHYHNQGGNVDRVLGERLGIEFPATPERKMCTRPFREFTLHYNGNVALCCNDWNDVYVAGNVLEEETRDIWFGERLNVARRALLAKHRGAIMPCAPCNDRSKRVGLENSWFKERSHA